MSKKRIALRLAEDEIAVIGTRDRWEHLIMVYETFAQDPEYGEDPSWQDAAEWIRTALKAAAPKVDYDDEEW